MLRLSISLVVLVLCIQHVVLINIDSIDQVDADPSELATLVTNQVFASQSYFLHWDYSGAIIVDGMFEYIELFNLPILDRLNTWLNSLITNPSEYGYKVVRNITVPWGGAVGDNIGLFPIVFLHRALYYSAHPNSAYSNETDMYIARTVAQKYVFEWHYTLPDGTFTRNSGWGGQGNTPTFLWADDHYMGMTLLSRLAIVDGNREYADRVAKMQLTYAARLLDTRINIYWHGANARNNEHSCCYWGRANGWIMMSHVEVLKALKKFPGHPLQSSVLSLFQTHSAGLLPYQSSEGRWHQLINNSTTFLETSCTAMFIWSYMQGVMEGWLSRSVYDPAIQKGWKALQTTITSTGVVNGICEGTGIGDDPDFYQKRSTAYSASGPGLGSVFITIATYQEYQKSNN